MFPKIFSFRVISETGPCLPGDWGSTGGEVSREVNGGVSCFVGWLQRGRLYRKGNKMFCMSSFEMFLFFLQRLSRQSKKNYVVLRTHTHISSRLSFCVPVTLCSFHIFISSLPVLFLFNYLQSLAFPFIIMNFVYGGETVLILVLSYLLRSQTFFSSPSIFL